MKKILLLLVGVISIGICCYYSIVGNGQEKSESIVLKVEEDDGEFNDDEGMSYKEGWSVFHANRYAYGYNWNWKLDNSIQNGVGAYANCFGRSTNWTVNSVFRDIYDKESPREPEDQYDLARDWMPNVAAKGEDYRKKLSNGLMFITMVKSKETTLAEYIQYMEVNGMIKNTTQFNEILKLNGIDANGNFTLGQVN
ncbi:hypothetical protein KQI58_00830 [Enterococcus raffinosus]|uniref:hypothetical protein n=1 Tax=Enterococcus raffinosus TaxID=71452 RepID=UPI001C0FF967|nr:hypothetical protein [Enterococcus raffinosus]MBU5359614.1 hypothetical protein [Enterococcus raffinosus]